MTEINEKTNVYIHLDKNYNVREGHAHLLVSYRDYKELEVFFSKNFDTFTYTHCEDGFPEKLYKCKRGSMFVRDKDGEIGR